MAAAEYECAGPAVQPPQEEERAGGASVAGSSPAEEEVRCYCEAGSDSGWEGLTVIRREQK